MINYKDLQEKGICWTGYKRKKGTKPYEDDSCMKEEKDAGGHGSEKHHVMAFGRMNPITSGHEAVVNKVQEVAKKNNATHGLVLSGSHDTTDKEKKAAKNPLSPEQKTTHAKNAFPGTNITSAKKGETILHHAAAAHKAGAEHLHVVAGSDRHEELHNLLHKYNDKESAHGHYNFKSITMHSSGARDPDSEGTTGISGSKMREHAKTGNKEAFHAGAPSKMKPEHKDAMYNDLRKNMNIKEETMDQQADHAKQLKRFKDQMSQANGQQKETATELDNLEKEIMVGAVDVKHGLMHNPDPSIESNVRVNKIKQMTEKLEPSMGAAAYIHDFISSTNPMFNNKSKEERRKMAIGAYMGAKAKLKEDNSHYEEAEEHLSKANDADAKGDKKTFHAHMANHHDSMSEWHDSKGRSASADKHAEKADYHHEKSLSEGTIQGNIGGGDAMNTTTSAPSASTVKDTTMGKKIKGFKFFNGENDKQMNMNQPVKEEKKDDVPFDGPYKSTFKKPNNPNRTGMDAARSLAQRAMDQVSKKAAAESFDYNFDMLEEAVKSIDSGEYDYEGQMARTQLQTICRNSTDLIDMLNDEDNMPEWVQSKITLAQDYISTVRDYLQSKEELGEGKVYDPLTKKIVNTKPIKVQAGGGATRNGVPVETGASKYKEKMNKEEVEEIEERNKANALMRKTMDASRGARFKVQNNLTGDAVRDWDGKHKTAQAQNKAIGRALRNEATTGNPGFGYHGQHKTEHDADAAYKKIHAHVKSLTDSDDKTVKHYLDSAHGRHLVGHENDHDHIKKDFKKFTKYYKPEMHEEQTKTGKPVNVDKVNHAGDKPHEEKWEPAPNTVSKLKKVKEENMKSYKEFLQSLDEKLIGKQHKIDKNKNNEVDAEDFELLRKEEAESLDEIEFDKSGKYVHKGTYGSSYNPKPGHEETPDDEKAEKMAAGRKTGQRTGSYKPRKTMSKLKQAGSTYK